MVPFHFVGRPQDGRELGRGTHSHCRSHEQPIVIRGGGWGAKQLNKLCSLSLVVVIVGGEAWSELKPAAELRCAFVFPHDADFLARVPNAVKLSRVFSAGNLLGEGRTSALSCDHYSQPYEQPFLLAPIVVIS